MKKTFPPIRFNKLDLPSFTIQVVLSWRPIILLVLTALGILISIYLTAMVIPVLNKVATTLSNDVSTTWIEESLKAFGAAFFAGIVALLISNTWQQKSTAVEMLKELHSVEFHSVRNALWTQAEIARSSKLDLTSLRAWFPVFDAIKTQEALKRPSDNEFLRRHALSSMVHFVVRISNYSRFGMLNIFLTRRLFKVFFLHYRILLLEFADAMDIYCDHVYVKSHANIAESEVTAIKQKARDIRYFFRILGVEYTLSEGVTYEYFYSLNCGIPNEYAEETAVDIDIEMQFKTK